MQLFAAANALSTILETKSSNNYHFENRHRGCYCLYNLIVLPALRFMAPLSLFLIVSFFSSRLIPSHPISGLNLSSGKGHQFFPSLYRRELRYLRRLLHVDGYLRANSDKITNLASRDGLRPSPREEISDDENRPIDNNRNS